MAILIRFLLEIVVGVEEVTTDCDAKKLTVKGTNIDLTTIRVKLEKKIKRKVELVSPQPKKDSGGGGDNNKSEEKKAKKKEEPKKRKNLLNRIFSSKN